MTKLKRISIIINFFLLGVLLPAPGYAFDNGDFQYWESQSIETKFGEKTKFKISEEFRFGDRASTLFYNHTEAGISYTFNEVFGIALNYRQIFHKNRRDVDAEYMPNMHVNVKLEFYGLIFKDRNRFEYRIKEVSPASWRYRNRITMELPLKWTPLNIQPYSADEIFYDFGKERMNQNRAYVGLKMDFLENLKGKIFYMHQSSLGKKWKESNIFGTSVNVMF